MTDVVNDLSTHELLVQLLRMHENKIVVDGVLDADYLAQVIVLIAERGGMAC